MSLRGEAAGSVLQHHQPDSEMLMPTEIWLAVEVRQRTCQIECQNRCQVECQKESQCICQIACQKKCQRDMPERMSAGMSEYTYKYIIFIYICICISSGWYVRSYVRICVRVGTTHTKQFQIFGGL